MGVQILASYLMFFQCAFFFRGEKAITVVSLKLIVYLFSTHNTEDLFSGTTSHIYIEF